MAVFRLPTKFNSSAEGQDYYFCRSQDYNIQQSCRDIGDHEHTTLVIGSLSQMGSIAVSYLSSSSMEVAAVADTLDVLDHREVWYRKEILRERFNASVKILNLTSKDEIERVFVNEERRISSIILMFPSSESKRELDGAENLDRMLSKAVAQLVAVLEVVRTLSLCTQVIIVSQNEQHGGAVKSTSKYFTGNGWVSLLRVLSEYGRIGGTPVTLLQTNSLDGICNVLLPENHLKLHGQFSSSVPNEGCFYIDKVMNVLMNTTRKENGCQLIIVAPIRNNSLDTDRVDLTVLQAWGIDYSKRKGPRSKATNKNVIFTSYFTSVKDPQRPIHRAPSQFHYMDNYYTSLKRLGLRTVIFHDGLDSGFQQRISSDYNKVAFERVESLHNRTTNDARFYAYYKYLLEHSGIGRVLLTDISDVTFQRDPFELVSLLGDRVYVGTDVDTVTNISSEPSLREKLVLCSGDLLFSLLMEKDSYYNAGIVAGHRERILSVLALMIAYMDKASLEENCNTPALNYVAHMYFFQDVFTGFPLHSRFRRRQSSPKGVYMVHK